MDFSAKDLDVIRELINIGVGKAAGVLNDLLGSHITLYVPSIEVVTSEDLHKLNIPELHKEAELDIVRLEFTGQFSGTSMIVFTPESGSNCVSILTDESPESPEFDAIKVETLTEAGNIVLNMIMGTVSNVIQECLDFRIPEYYQQKIGELLQNEIDDNKHDLLLAKAKFHSESQNVTGNVLIIFHPGTLAALVPRLKEYMPEDSGVAAGDD